MAYYYTVTTITTVGYGDISANGTPERVFAIILMVVGVFAFSFATGSLATIISSFDENKAEIQSKMQVLDRMIQRYHLNPELSAKLKTTVHFQLQNSTDEFTEFLSTLDPRLK